MWFLILPLGAVGVAIYSKSKSKRRSVSVGKVAVWGHPDAGKTSFVSVLRGKPVDKKKMVENEIRSSYSNIIIKDIIEVGQEFIIEEVVDIPGTHERMNEWIKIASKSDSLFFIVDMSKVINDDKYYKAVERDLKNIEEKLGKAAGNDNFKPNDRGGHSGIKRVNLIFSHVDMVESLENINLSEMRNTIVNHREVKTLYSALSAAAFNIYHVNFLDPDSSRRLLRSIAGDWLA